MCSTFTGIRKSSHSSKVSAPPWRAIEAPFERVFRGEFTGSVERWSLVLVPLDRQLARTVKQVQIDGGERPIAQN